MAGPFYFAWADENEDVFLISAHAREDEAIVAFDVTQSEGDFASLKIEIKNPRIGLLNPARKQWCWLSWDDGTTIVPLFRGRLVGIPTLRDEAATIEFLARPVDFVAQKTALAASLKVAPFWDPVFIDANKRSDPDAVLEARTAIWHIDRVTGEVTISDLIVGEDGVEEFLASEVPYDSLDVALEQQPLVAVSVDGQVGWTQASKSNPSGIGRDYKFTARTYTGSSIVEGWPKADTSLDHGWIVAKSSITSSFEREKARLSSGSVQGKPADFSDVDPFGFEANFGQSEFGDDDPAQVIASMSWSNLGAPKDWQQIVEESKTHGGVDSSSVEQHGFYIPAETIAGSIRFGYDASRQRREHVQFTLAADVQAIESPRDEADTLSVSMSGVDVGAQAEGTPIGDVGRPTYFATDRGQRSIEYLLMVARAHLVLRSRAVSVRFQVPFARVVALTCRKGALLHERRLPGGQAAGKIIECSFSANGDGGELIGTVKIGCCVGHGSSVTAGVGEPSYVDTGYVDAGYQHYDGQIMLVGAGDVGYSRPVFAPVDDGVYFPLTQPIFIEEPTYEAAPVPQLESFMTPDAAHKAFKGKGDTFSFTLKPLDTGPFEAVYAISVTDLVLPKDIDLEAT